MTLLARPSAASRTTSLGEASTASSAVSSSDGGDSEDETLHTIHRRLSLNNTVHNNNHNNNNNNNHDTVHPLNDHSNKLSSTELLRLSAVESYHSVFEGSKLPDQSQTYPKFDTREVQIGKLLGQGGFANVYEVCGFTLQKDFVIEHSERSSELNVMTKHHAATTNSNNNNNNPEDDEHDNNDDIDNIEKVAAAAANELHTKLGIQRQHASRQFLARHCFRKKDDVGMNATEHNEIDAYSSSNASSSTKSTSNHAHATNPNYVARYALKRLKPVVVADPPTLLQGICDMATESRFLASLEYHPNIVKLRGMAQDRFSAGYFIVMDRLGDTLEQRIATVWKPMLKRSKLQKVMNKIMVLPLSTSEKMKNKWQLQKNESLVQRLIASFGIASALAHLHKHGILYRDLKPANCGFDVRDDIKIFDFGLAKEIGNYNKVDDGDGDNIPSSSSSSSSHHSPAVFQLTAMCGTPRYMAPEVALGKPYNESCDVYSFGILCWQILRLRKPYGKKCTFELLQKVWSATENDDIAIRPICPRYWPNSIVDMLQRSMSADITKRPSIEDMKLVLVKEFEVLSNSSRNSNNAASAGASDRSGSVRGGGFGVFDIGGSSSILGRKGTSGGGGGAATAEEEMISPTTAAMDSGASNNSNNNARLTFMRRRSTHIFQNGRGMGMKTSNDEGARIGRRPSFFANLLDSASFRRSDRSLFSATNRSDASLSTSMRGQQRKSDTLDTSLSSSMRLPQRRGLNNESEGGSYHFASNNSERSSYQNNDTTNSIMRMSAELKNANAMINYDDEMSHEFGRIDEVESSCAEDKIQATA